MIDNNIIQSLGAGSGIDTSSLVQQLTAIERSGPQSRIDTKRETIESQVSDFGLLSSALATLEDAAEVLTDPEGLFSKTASYTESDALVPSELDTNVQAGVYSFEVTEIASSQSLAFTTFTNTTDAVGEGTLTFDFGSWTRGAGPTYTPTAFVQDATQASQVITIDSNNNTLEGLRDAINDADFGVQASIVNDGSGYVLSLLATSGDNNQIEITASESGGSPTNTDSSDLSRFAFNTGVTSFENKETQRGKDMALSVNGLAVTRSSNSVDDVVDGLTLDILKASVGEIITVTVTEDKAYAEQNIRDFITAYNDFIAAVEPIVGFSEVENEDGSTDTVAGSLQNDSLAKSILSQIRNLIASPVTGLTGSSYTSLTNIGIRTELDGTLSISEEEFDEAFENNFADIQKLLAENTASTSSFIQVNSVGENTTPGQYAVSISAPPTHGIYAGGDIDDAQATFPNFDTTGKTYTFKATINGTETSTLTLPTATYADKTAMASAIQTLINSDSNLQTNNYTVTVSHNTTSDGFDITSARYGSGSTVNITEASADSAADLGLAVASGTAGVTVTGAVNSVTAFGSANVLLPALGEPGEGLAMLIDTNATSATVNYSRGFAGDLQYLIEDHLSSSGLIATRETNLSADLEDLDDDQDSLERRMSAFEERLIQQYINMERIISSLNSSGSFIESLIDTLPFTANNK